MGKYVVSQKKIDGMKDKASSRGSMRFLKKDTTTNLRMLLFEDEKGDYDFGRLMAEHRIADSTGKNLGICLKETFGEECAICRANALSSEQGEKRKFNTRNRFVVNAYDVNESKPKVQRWVLPSTAFDQILNYLGDEQYADICDPKVGHSFLITRSGEGLNTEYAVKLSRSPVKVPANLLKEVIDPMTEIKKISIETQCDNAGLDIEELFNEGEIATIEEDAKKNKKKTPAKAAKGKDLPFDVGVAVWCDEDGEDVEYTVVSIGETDVNIENEDGDQFEVPINTIHLVGETEPEENGETESIDAINVGSLVWCDEDGEDVAYSVAECDPDADTSTIEDDNGETYEVPFSSLHLASTDEPEPETETEESGELEVGSYVTCPADGDDVVYEVIKIDDDNVQIENDSGDIFEVSVDEVEISEVPF